MPDFVYLASASPRRRALLQQIGVPLRIIAVAVDETVVCGEPPPAYVARLAAAKAEAGWLGHAADPGRGGGARDPGPRIPVLAADTAVVLAGRIMGKPEDAADAEAMLTALSDKWHEVFTAVALRDVRGLDSRISRTEVRFRRIEPWEARAYSLSAEPLDKAGAYAIQGHAAVFAAELKGSYSGVMGLPLFETAELLRSAGVRYWNQDHEPRA